MNGEGRFRKSVSGVRERIEEGTKEVQESELPYVCVYVVPVGCSCSLRKLE